jgi:hypothetical protein
VTAEELAALHPRLFHVTSPGAWPLIERHGLLSTEALLDLFEVEDTRRQSLLGQRRPAEVPIAHERHGTAVLNDNLPLSARALERCLDDGLSPADWLRLLNARVFFWADEDGLARLLSARMNRGRRRAVLVFDTLALVADNAARVELCPSNSGATIRKAARRGLATFTPLSAMGYREWRARRGGRDRILEVVVRGGVPKAARYLIERREVGDT